MSLFRGWYLWLNSWGVSALHAFLCHFQRSPGTSKNLENPVQIWWNEWRVSIKQNNCRLSQRFACWAGAQSTNRPRMQIWSNTFSKRKKTLVTQSFSWQYEAPRIAVFVCMLLKALNALSCMRDWRSEHKKQNIWLFSIQYDTCKFSAYWPTCWSRPFS